MSRYLITRLPWKDVAPSLNEKNGVLKEKLERIEKRYDETFQNEQRLKITLDRKTDTLQKLQQEHEIL